MRLYLDAAPVIYAVEQVTPFFPVLDARLSAAGTVRGQVISRGWNVALSLYGRGRLTC